MSVRELHNRTESPTNESGTNKAIYVENNIIISDYKLRSIIPPQLKKMSERYKVICGCECCIPAKRIHSLLLSYCDHYLRKLNDLSQKEQNRRFGEMVNLLLATYKNI